MSKDLKGTRLARIWEQSVPHRGNSRCEGPEVGAVMLRNGKAIRVASVA